MSILNDNIDFINEYESEQNVIDQPIVNNPTTPVPSSNEQAITQPSVDNSLVEKYRSAFAATQSPKEYDAIANAFKAELTARQSVLPNLGMFASGTSLTDKNALLESLKNGTFSVNPEMTRSFTDKVEYNLGINLGPSSTANIDSVLTTWESDNGYYLQPDNFGIYRKSKNGIMDANDAYKVSILDGAYDKAVHDAFTELVGNSINVSLNSSISKNVTKDDISDIIKELSAKGIKGDGQYFDIKEWSAHYNEIQKKIDDYAKGRNLGQFNFKGDYYGIINLASTGKITATPIDYNNFSFGYDPFPFFPFTPKGTQDYYFSRAGKQNYHMLAAEAWDLAPTTVDVLVTTVPALWELKPYYNSIKPAISAVCEVEKNMHLHWEDVEMGKYTYLSAVKESLLPLGLELGPAGYTAKNVTDAIARKYGLPEEVKPVLENILSKIMVNIIERVAYI